MCTHYATPLLLSVSRINLSNTSLYISVYSMHENWILTYKKHVNVVPDAYVLWNCFEGIIDAKNILILPVYAAV